MGNSNSTAFGSSTTAEEVMKGVSLKDQVIVITGSSAGIGKYTAKMLLKAGATVIGANRNQKKSQTAKNEIITEILKENNNKTTKNEQKKDENENKNDNNNNDNNDNIFTKDALDNKYILITLDLNSLKSVKSFVDEFNKLNLSINCLINNAGIMALPDYQTTEDGFEKQFGVNHLGHFYLTNLLMNNLLQTYKNTKIPVRIVNLSSNAHMMPPNMTTTLNNVIKTKKTLDKSTYSAWKNYGISKASNIIFTRELDYRFNKQGIVSYAVHPGVIRTELRRYAKGFLMGLINKLGKPIEKSVTQGSSTTLYVTTQPIDKLKSGVYYDNCNIGTMRIPGDTSLEFEKDNKLYKNSLQYKLWIYSVQQINTTQYKVDNIFGEDILGKDNNEEKKEEENQDKNNDNNNDNDKNNDKDNDKVKNDDDNNENADNAGNNVDDKGDEPKKDEDKVENEEQQSNDN